MYTDLQYEYDRKRPAKLLTGGKAALTGGASPAAEDEKTFRKDTLMFVLCLMDEGVKKKFNFIIDKMMYRSKDMACVSTPSFSSQRGRLSTKYLGSATINFFSWM